MRALFLPPVPRPESKGMPERDRRVEGCCGGGVVDESETGV